MTTSPSLTTARAREARQETDARLGRVDALIAYSRLAVFVAAIAVAVLAFKATSSRGPWLLAPVAAFLFLVVVHDRVIRARGRAERAARLYEEGIARIEDRAPPGDGRSGRFNDEAHPYEMISICSARARSSSGCRPRARRWAKRHSRPG